MTSKSTCTRTIYGTSTRGMETVPDGAGRMALELIYEELPRTAASRSQDSAKIHNDIEREGHP